MNKFFVLLVGLAMVSFNAFAAVNVNTATQEQLETLNGIGPVKAKTIIEYRNKNGAFKTVEDLDKVPGIGAGVLGKIKGDVTLTGPTTVKAEAKSDAKKAAPVKSTTPAAPMAQAEDKKADVSKVDAKANKKAAAKAKKDAKKAEMDAKADKKDAKK